MDKKQFLQFKSDLKKSIEDTKLCNKYVKAWWNLGFKSEEEYNQKREEDFNKRRELEKSIHKNEKGYQVVYADSFTTHWAYYCAKHQLSEDDIVKYCENELNKLTENKRNYYRWNIGKPLDSVKKILNFYESLVCSD